MKHVDLKPGLGKVLVAAKATPARATQPHGVKVMADGEDTRWTRPDGTGVSVREVDTHVEETRQSLADSLVRLQAGEAAVQELQDVTLPALQETLDDLGDQIAAGSTTTVWSADAPGETPGVAEGQVWLQTVSDTDATVIGQWTWGGTAWKPVLIRSEVIAALDVSKLTAAEAVIAEAVIDKLFAQTFAAHKIAAEQIDAESVAAAVGTFVKIDVSQLTATTADLNEVVAQKIAGGIARFVELSADQITGGRFTGETFVGGTFTGGVFETSDAMPGRVTLSDTAGNWNGTVIPGIQVEPIDASGYSRLPYIGPDQNGMAISGGVATTGSAAGAALRSNYASLYYNGKATATTAPRAHVAAMLGEASLAYQADGVNKPIEESRIWVTGSTARMRVRLSEDAFSSIKITQDGSEMVARAADGTYSRSDANTSLARLLYSSQNSFAKIEVNDNEAVIWREKRVNGARTRYDIFAFDENGLTYKQADFDAAGNASNVRSTPLGDTGWRSDLAMTTGWSMPTGNVGPWQPLRYRLMMGTVWVSGYLRKNRASVKGEYMCRLPVGFRPSRFFDVPGRGQINPDGIILCPEAGGTEVAVSFSFPLG
ncbi:hypothetical protein [Brachybacterium nesterenkovii]|uniref:hypothetical protein n=1 Tax=Brachybacterium nesterenkovii TaxID=47847 RepID=UPI00321907E5